ncbi:XRE family transcriptional regulator [Xanthomonas hortorum]|uniref:Helix-turn-helix domain-containing protein n=1 Tax=Xanthomonas hortorum TaxID=56454 RepID=A0AA47IEH2_9XANT|nr:XRE family transcriptional regulator [Xanthomonas hortorum]MCE4360540.1 helix-turn-helix domain-containing protein [Xanthomonas hortorum pv. taraxaci]NMI54066.1 hypothetical protein [Xanthomonas hortorum pv. taraxaci]WAH66889.1 helix-turn-helix domain-containing protein [Xanthomonas hortorum]CAD0362263.1 hypothetical protein NCPPB940_44470 [Xanthomonas hortorum pv. taraxaci]CAD0362268.1 hypothetical protein NCPPB940_44470 [Xanthomonas hortorum pv. taraxaci]
MVEFERSSGNVYADLHHPDAAAMHARANLVASLDAAIEARRWSREQAADALGLPVPELARVLQGHFHAYQVDDVAGWLDKARGAR